MPWDKDYAELPLTFERGLLESVQDSMLPVGAAARLRNWVSQPSGNLAVRPPWQMASDTGAPATRKGAGIGTLALPRRPYVRQSKTGTIQGTDPQSASATWDAATTTGNCLVALVYVTDTTARLPSAHSITAPASWVVASSPDATSRNAHCWIYYKPNAASESGSVSFTDTVAAGADSISVGVEIMEVANVTTAPLDKAANADNTTSNNPVSGTTAAQTVPVGIAIAAFNASDTTDDTYSAPTNSFVLTHELYVDNSTADMNAVGAYHVYSDGAAQSVSVAVDNSPTTSGAVIATFKAVDYAVTDGLVIEANDESPNIKFYYLDRDDLAGGTNVLLDTIAGDLAGTPVAFTSGNEMLFYVHPSFTGVRAWAGPSAGASPAYVSGSPAGRCIAWHKNRLWVGGTVGEPWKLFFSEFEDHTIWNAGSASYIPVGRGDGEAIEDITPFQDGLLIGKQTSAYYLTGGSPDTFRLIRLPIGGAAPGRTVLSTQYGGILAGRESAWLFDGSGIGKMTEPIKDSYGLTGDWMTVSYLDDKASICDEGSGTVWTFDFVTQTWSEEIVDDASTEGPAVIYNQGKYQYFSPKNATVGSLFSYRTLPAFTPGKDFDTLDETFEAWTPELWMGGPSEKQSPRYLYLKLRQHGGTTGDTGLTVTPYYNGTAGTPMVVPAQATPGPFWVRESFDFAAAGSNWLQLRFSQMLPSTEASAMDIEEVVIGFNRERVA